MPLSALGSADARWILGGMTDRPPARYLKRFTVCKLVGHTWAKIAYPPAADDEGTGTFLRCLRCNKENHEAGTFARGAGGLY